MHEKAKEPHRNMPAHEHSKTKSPPPPPTQICRALQESFDHVSRREKLEKCKRGATQNNNENFHNVVWNMARKTQFCSLTTLKLIINLAVAKHNLGCTSGLSRCLVAVTGQEDPLSRMIASYTGLDRDG